MAAAIQFLLSASVSLSILGARPRLLIDCLLPAILGASGMAATVWVLGHTVLSEQNSLNLALLSMVGAIIYGAWVMCIRHDGVRAIRRDVFADLSGLLNRLEPVVDEESD